MRAICLCLLSLVCASIVAAEPPGPTTYVWQLTCPDEVAYAAYSLPEQCTEMRATIAQTCEQPLVSEARFDAKARAWRQVDVPNPRFVRIADVCKDAHNGRDCVCEYVAVHAEPASAERDLEAARVAAADRAIEAARAAAKAAGRRFSVLDMVNAAAAARAAVVATGPIKVGP